MTHNAEFIQPFMVGPSAEALIFHYENVDPDPRILPAIQRGVDHLWDKLWFPNINIDPAIMADGPTASPAGTGG